MPLMESRRLAIAWGLILASLSLAPGTEQEWLDQAATNFKGEVLLASDLLTTEV